LAERIVSDRKTGALRASPAVKIERGRLYGDLNRQALVRFLTTNNQRSTTARSAAADEYARYVAL
jgi:hypothetical protein